ncbi:MAG: LytR C-terminal domain-containing protein [bacterium]|nr:LytR C-terminal domain-containing protein [bacterium]
MPTKATQSDSQKASIKVVVQNGSGEAGVGSKAADILKSAGYDVVSTANADNFDYTDVTIQVKAAKKSALSLLEGDLSSDYTIGKTSADLPVDTSYDALVIIGK